MAFAIAEVGISRADLDLITPDEFEAIVNRYANSNEHKFRNDWERARFLALYSLAPYSKRALKPCDVCVFDWEKDKEVILTPKQMLESRTRGKELVKQMGEFTPLPLG